MLFGEEYSQNVSIERRLGETVTNQISRLFFSPVPPYHIGHQKLQGDILDSPTPERERLDKHQRRMAPALTNSELLPNAVAGLGVALCFFGVGALWNAQSFVFNNWAMRGVPSAAGTSPAEKQQHKIFLALAHIYGLRNILLGLLTITIRLSGDRRLMGWSMLIGALEPLGDGMIQYSLNGVGVMRHLMIVPFSLGLSAGLLGWL